MTPLPPPGATAVSGEPILIGWKEYLDLPDWGVSRIKTKVDTGARTSALDVASCTLEERSEGMFVRLELSARRRRRHGPLVQVEVPVLGFANVASSNGVREQRPVIETTIRLGPVVKRIRLTVTDRSSMLFPMLLGREALAGSFVVDVGHKYLLGKRRSPDGTKA